ncbi:hypothetical protein MMC14_001661 [Varicellaria rhodocarpa]|nr:hypothetical protein [Varicellaria rhodocarpa]
MASFPLCCNICPKQPDFSDLSHLLTHISSKGHLSHYFKARVRSDQEPSIRQQLQIYDDWYERNHLGRLLSQRMAEKDSKAANAKNRTTNIHVSGPAKQDKKAIRKRGPSRRLASVVKQEDVLDPLLYNESAYPHSLSNTGAFSPSKLASMNRAYVPPMKGHSKTAHDNKSTKRDLPRTRCNVQSEETTERDISIDDVEPLASKVKESKYPDPTTLNLSLLHAHMLTQSPTITDRDIAESVEDERAPGYLDQGLTEGSKLKGIIWPGMDLFDSASPDAKRRRNQKKNGSILEHLLITSVTVQPTEIIFDPTGALYKKRHISGQVESSPVREIVAPKPNRRRSKVKRPALKEMSINAPRRTQKPQNAGQISGLNIHPSTHSEDVSKQEPLLQRFSLAKEHSHNHGHGHGHSRTTVTKHSELDWRLTGGGNGRKRKEGFKVYDDRETMNQVKTEEAQIPVHPGHQQHAQVPSLFYHTPGYAETRYDPAPAHELQHLNHTFVPPQYPLVQNVGSVPSLGTTESPIMQEDFTCTTPGNNTDKENIEPIIDQIGRIDSAAPQMSYTRPSQRYFIQDYRSPQFFDAPPPHLDLNTFHHPGMFGHTMNPLTYTFHQPIRSQFVPPVTFQHGPLPAQPIINPRGMMTRPGGPASENDNLSDDGTIPDETGDMEESDDWNHWF